MLILPCVDSTRLEGESRVMTEALHNNYQVCEEIGRGRFGVVSRCVSAASGDSFAVKSVEKRSLLDDDVDRQCLDREVKITRLLVGVPNVVSISDVYEDDSHLHMVLDLCESPDLFRRLSRTPFPEAEAAAVARPLALAVAACHSRGVAHRDIKPDNVLFDRCGSLHLADFGSAELFRDGELMSGIVGTPYYVAPEVVAGRGYGEKVDVWSVGVILYTMLAGMPPFYGESVPEIFEAVLRSNLRFPHRLFHSVSPAAKDLLRRMLSKDVSTRFSADQVLRHPWMMS